MINSALILLAGQVLQTAATSAGRLVLTGQAQNANYTAAQFKSNVCASLTVMFNCASNLYIDVESTSTSSFSGINLANPTNSNGTLNTSGFGYSLGNPGDLVIVRLIYQWPIAGVRARGRIDEPGLADQLHAGGDRRFPQRTLYAETHDDEAPSRPIAVAPLRRRSQRLLRRRVRASSSAHDDDVFRQHPGHRCDQRRPPSDAGREHCGRDHVAIQPGRHLRRHQYLDRRRRP